MPKPALILQHHPIELCGIIGGVLSAKGIPLETWMSFDGTPIPRDPANYSAIVVMGGPMGVYEHEDHPFITNELALIEKAIKKDVPLLGVCLGSQLIAAALGARIYRGKEKEIGFQTVTLTPNGINDPVISCMGKTFNPLLWHGDIFDLPKGAVRLASSEATDNQAFSFGKAVYGFLFHLEAGKKQVKDMTRAFAKELVAENIDPALLIKEAETRIEGLQIAGAKVFNSWSELI